MRHGDKHSFRYNTIQFLHCTFLQNKLCWNFTLSQNLNYSSPSHPLSITAYPIQGCQGDGAYPSCQWAKSRVHPGWQFITGPMYRGKHQLTLTLTPTENHLSISIKTVGGTQYQEESHVCTGRTHDRESPWRNHPPHHLVAIFDT